MRSVRSGPSQMNLEFDPSELTEEGKRQLQASRLIRPRREHADELNGLNGKIYPRCAVVAAERFLSWPAVRGFASSIGSLCGQSATSAGLTTRAINAVAIRVTVISWSSFVLPLRDRRLPRRVEHCLHCKQCAKTAQSHLGL
jgi:hypothetical protein